MNADLLERLCASCGVLTAYRDMRGEARVVPIKTRLALLAAMGWSVATDADVERALAAREARAWRRMLTPVQVVRGGSGDVTFLVCVPDAYSGMHFEWTLVEESGARHTAAFVPAECEPVARHRIAGAGFARFEIAISRSPALGYHRIELSAPGHEEVAQAVMTLIVAPQRCYLPDAVSGGRGWGPVVNLYALRSGRNWGIGDFSDLTALVELGGRQGASMVAVNPLHALFPHDPDHASPYSPSSRSFINVLYLDVESLPEFAESPAAQERVASAEFQAELRALRAASLVDYRRVARLKFQVLELLYAHFLERHLMRESERASAFRSFQHEQGEALRLASLFFALQESLYAADATRWGWRSWPAEYRDPRSTAVETFARNNARRIEYWDYLQWNAARQLAAAGARSLALRLGVGIYQDLAVGADPGGAETWSEQGLYAAGVSVGSPPDEFNMKGQDWGIVPALPERLTDAAYAPFAALLRANMRHAGALRIDHVMGLVRLFWVPAGAPADCGGYVSQPADDLLGVLALESVRNQCLVIGEDLGTLPDGLAEKLRAESILSYRLLYFERESDGAFRPPGRYPELALATVSTHDLPTLRGFWLGHDLDLRARLELFPGEDSRRRSLVDRAQARVELRIALEREGLLPPGVTVHAESMPEPTPEFALAVHRFLARSACRLLAVQPENVFGEIEQVNLPATTAAQHPNWRRRLSLDLESWEAHPRFAETIAALHAERGPADKAARAFAMRIPDATYRLQFNRGFTFAQATDLVPYLHALGVSHVYASPWFSARPGSLHGYDVVDHNAFNPEIGSAGDFERFAQALRARGMGQILDLVPNHMGVMGADNAWWLDVLENGPASAFAPYFDIDWHGSQPDLSRKVLLPILADHYGVMLERGELHLEFDAQNGTFSVFYHTHRFPIDPVDYPRVLASGFDRPGEGVRVDAATLAEFQALIGALGRLPPREVGGEAAVLERSRDKEVHKRRLAQLCREYPALAGYVAGAVAAFNGEPGRPESFDALDQLLGRQAYRLAHWRVAGDEINYRRFFDISDLAALRMEDERVFAATHELTLRLLETGMIDGLRIDHPDGLYDPARYFARLQGHFADRRDTAASEGKERPVYLVLEKILADHERLPDDWPVHGTTGYRFANLASGLFVDGAAEAKFDRIYQAFVRERVNYAELLHQCRLTVVKSTLASELNMLANRASRIARADRHTRDYTLNGLREALAAIVACFPVYRTYIAGRTGAEDRRYLDWAVGAARKRCRPHDSGALEFIYAVLTGEAAGDEARRREMLDFVMRFQQFTAAVAAKGMEDTAFYRYNRLASLNEVGGNPLCFGISLDAFHHASADRARHWPHTMLSTSTHDSKRSEDARVRIDALSEFPDEWWARLQRWRRLNRGRKRQLGGEPAPCANDEYLLYQALIGTWPAEEPDDEALARYRERIGRYCLKAAREAKVNTDWVHPDDEYEAALQGFVSALLSAPQRNAFLADFSPFARRIARVGMFNSLSQVAIKIASPGVPDFYQGSELWLFHLVDPDNRAPVDYALRRRLLEELQGEFDCPPEEVPARARSLLSRLEDGRAKLFVTWRALRARGMNRALFAAGAYVPLETRGTHGQRLCAFARSNGESAAVLVVPRLLARMVDGGAMPLGHETWGDTRVDLPVELRGTYRNAFTREIAAHDDNGALAAGAMLRNFPVALLLREKRV